MRNTVKGVLTGLIIASGMIVASTVAGAMRARKSSMPVFVHFTESSTCQISFSDQTFSLPDDKDRIMAALRELRKHWRALSISGGSDTPYKCIGSAIYLAQLSGFKNVQFKAQTAKL